jgi:hypothetical protein
MAETLTDPQGSHCIGWYEVRAACGGLPGPPPQDAVNLAEWQIVCIEAARVGLSPITDATISNEVGLVNLLLEAFDLTLSRLRR